MRTTASKTPAGAIDPGLSVVHHVHYGVVHAWQGLEGRQHIRYSASLPSLSFRGKHFVSTGGDELGNFAGGEVRA